MVKYVVTVFTADLAAAATLNKVFIKLVGTDGESERKWLMSLKGASAFIKGAVSLKSHICVIVNYADFKEKLSTLNSQFPLYSVGFIFLLPLQ